MKKFNARIRDRLYKFERHHALGLLFIFVIVFMIFSYSFNQHNAFAAGARVQTITGNNGAGGTTVSATWPSATTTDNLLVAIVAVDGGTNVTISPPASWILAVSADNGGRTKSSIYYIENAASESGVSSWGLSASKEATITLAEYSGMATSSALDVTASAIANSLTVDSGTTSTTAQADSLAVAGIAIQGIVTYSAETNSFTEVSEVQSSTIVSSAFYEKILSTTGTQQVQATISVKQRSVGVIAVFKAASTFEQSAYRFFNNADSTDVGSALASQDTAATLSSDGDAFRLRSLLHIGVANLASSGENFKLQFSERSGTCDTGFSGETYTDVTAGTAIAYNNNTTPSDGDNLTSNANDPTHGGDTITNQDYEELNNFTNSVSAINVGQDGKWDFSLIDNDGTSPVTYCLRIVKSDNSVLDTYSVIPEITTAADSTLFDTGTVIDVSTTVARADAVVEMLSVTVQDADAGNLESIVVDTGSSAEGDVDQVRLYLDGTNCNATGANGTFESGSDTLLGSTGTTGGETAAFLSGTATFDKDNTDESTGLGDISTVCSLTTSLTYFIVYELSSSPTDTNAVTAQIDASQIASSGGIEFAPSSDSSTASVTIDTTPPTVTTANISVTGATGTSGAFKNGDTAVPTWNN
ncbi:hypothetical protein COB64_04180, partial [Candidatus Wolfebacteria bacterium]